MKTTLKTQLPVSSLMIIMIACGPDPEKKTSKQSTRQEQHNASEMQAMAAFASPVGNAEYEVMLQSGKVAYSRPDPANSGNYIFANRIQPRINLKDFENYFLNTSQGTFDGIRVYPGLTNSDEMVFVMCQANFDNDQESNYVVLEESDYTGSTTFPVPVQDPTEPRAFHTRYYNTIKIMFYDQFRSNTPIYNGVKFSRYYPVDELKELIKDNLGAVAPPVPNDYPGYKIKLEFGYIPAEFAGNLQNRFEQGSYSDTQLQGFTCMMHLQRPDDSRMIDERLGYGGTNNYLNRYLEVGHPCPPRCGTLHQ